MNSTTTIKLNKEEHLSLDWLDARGAYDDGARSEDLIKSALETPAFLNQMALVDLGCGTGNNALQLIKHLRGPVRVVLVEQHAYLLRRAVEKFTQLFNFTVDRSGVGNIRLKHTTISIEFVCSNIFDWLGTHQSVGLLCCGSLLDLLSRSEAERLIKHVVQRNGALLASLNYEAAVLSTDTAVDTSVISAFEDHMRRELDKGNPLGAQCVAEITQIAQSLSLNLSVQDSHWLVGSTDSDFLQMNLDFYFKGAMAMAVSEQQRSTCENWLNEKLHQIASETLELKVFHRDVFLS